MKGLHPVTLKRLKAFRNIKRSWVSLWLLLAIYTVSLLSNLVANDRPLLVHANDQWYAPAFFYVTEDEFLKNGRSTRPDYKAIDKDETFSGRMIWPPIPYGPNEGIRTEDIAQRPTVNVHLRSTEQVARVDISPAGKILRARNADWLGEIGSSPLNLLDLLPDETMAAVEARFLNQKGREYRGETTLNGVAVAVQLSPYSPRPRNPRTVRITLREILENPVNERFKVTQSTPTLPANLNTDQTATLQTSIEELLDRGVGQSEVQLATGLKASLVMDTVSFPYRPVKGHIFGLDSSGRDVLVRVLYATRIALNFGFALVLSTMLLGVIIGSLQGFFGGWIDLTGQRIIEVWEALPFLYIMMLLGSVMGQSFWLLFIVYSVFGWIGISYYMRAEFLRLRSMPYIDSVRVMGLPAWKIMLRHILPNSLVPVITFVPFALVGAISSLTALDFLGFGLPTPTPSWGELFAQAQEFYYAWWLAFFPFLVLFSLILLSTFIGEGIREAYDPRRSIKWEG